MALLNSSSGTKFLLNNPKEVSLPFRVEKPMFMPWSFKIFRYFKVVVAMFEKWRYKLQGIHVYTGKGTFYFVNSFAHKMAVLKFLPFYQSERDW